MAAENDGYWTNVDGKPTYVEPGSRMYEDAPYDVDEVLGRFAKRQYGIDSRIAQEDRAMDDYYRAKELGLIGPEIRVPDHDQTTVDTERWHRGTTGRVMRGLDQLLLGTDGEGEIGMSEGNLPLWAYFLPKGLGTAAWVGDESYNIGSGKHVPGVVDAMFLAGPVASILGGAAKALKGKKIADKSARYLKGTKEPLQGVLKDANGNTVYEDAWRWAPEKKMPERLKGKTVYDTDGNVIDLESILNGKVRR